MLGEDCHKTCAKIATIPLEALSFPYRRGPSTRSMRTKLRSMRLHLCRRSLLPDGNSRWRHGKIWEIWRVQSDFRIFKAESLYFSIGCDKIILSKWAARALFHMQQKRLSHLILDVPRAELQRANGRQVKRGFSGHSEATSGWIFESAREQWPKGGSIDGWNFRP